MIRDSKVTILFDSEDTNYFISPFVVEHCRLVAARQDVDWEVELASRARVSVDSLIHKCLIKIGDMFTTLHLHITPLGSYDVFLGMDCLCGHSANMDCR